MRQKQRKVKRSAATMNQTPGSWYQCSATEPQHPDDHQPSRTCPTTQTCSTQTCDGPASVGLVQGSPIKKQKERHLKKSLPRLHSFVFDGKQKCGEKQPGSRHLGEGEKEHLMFTICAMHQFPKILVLLRGITTTLIMGVSRFFPCERCIPPTMLCVNDNEGAMKPPCSSIARIIHAFAQHYYTQ